MGNISSKIVEEDLILLGLLDKKEKPEYKKKNRSFIHVPIDRKYIGMTQKERDAVSKVSKRN